VEKEMIPKTWNGDVIPEDVRTEKGKKISIKYSRRCTERDRANRVKAMVI
jgi:hypothetical protein